MSVDCSGEYVVLRIVAEVEKGFRDRVLPVAPEFAEWLRATLEVDLEGKVFTLAKRSLKLHGVSRTVCRIGGAARVLVNQELGKSASAHDFRRAFGTRWATRVQPAILRELMRHQSIETTMRYYVGMQSAEVAKHLQVWAGSGEERRPNPSMKSEGDRLGDQACATAEASSLSRPLSRSRGTT